MQDPLLVFEFEDALGNIYPIQFIDPINIYQTTDLEEIPSIFNKLEQAIDEGFYVAGYVSYEAAPAFEGRYQVQIGTTLPLIWFAIFEKPLPYEPQIEKKDYHVSDWSFMTNYQNYQQGINEIKKAIASGDTYQVNYTTRLQATFKGDDFSFYKQLVKNQEAPYSAYLNLGEFQILSASPELFFRVKDEKVTTKPMKGTIHRGRFLGEDHQLIKQLQSSEKERAENMMIVDLLRNDLGKIATPGTVQVPKLLDVESYPTVHQMTSTITAELKAETTLFDWFQALFPCGSITGAPKIKTMEYIADLEKTPREVYCGAIGYITPEKEAIFNVPIRTVIIDQKKETAIYGVGGGVTWDSTVKNEYEEMRTKAKMLIESRQDFQLLESILLEAGDYPLLNYHMKRLADSALYFNYTVPKDRILELLEELKGNYPVGKFKVRLLTDRSGEVTTEIIPVKEITNKVTCLLSEKPIDEDNPFFYHKTTNRSIYDAHTTNNPKVFSTLLWNKRREITEFTFGNVVLEKNGRYYTPPLTSGLLPGTYRNYLLEKGIIEERMIRIEELAFKDRMWFINSIRGWVEVELVE